jgi:MscS family membrane protein
MNFNQVLKTYYGGNTLQQYMLFAGIIVFGLLFLRLFSKIFSRLLYKGFQKFSAEVRLEKFVELLLKPVETLLLITIIYVAINQLSYPLEEAFIKRKTFSVTYQELLDKLFLFSMILSLQWVVLRMIDFIALVFSYRASLTDSKADDQLVPFVRELSKIIAIIIGIFVLLGMVFEINVLTLIAGLGIGGIAIALAAKDSLENLFGSFTIFLDKPFVVGDLVKVDGIEGTIEKVGFRSTQVRGVDRSVITIPNRKMIDDALENLTLRNFRRVKFNIGIGYGTSAQDTKLIVHELQQMLNNHKHLNEEAIVVLDEFGDYSIKILVLYFVEMMEYYDFLKVKEEINYEIMLMLQKRNIPFAYPTYQIVK